MADSTLTFETNLGVPQQENAVTETANAGAFPSGFSTNGLNSAQNTVMIVVDTTLETNRHDLLIAIDRLKKSIEQSVNFT